MPSTDRRSSTSSEDASLPPTRQILPDGTEFIPTRTAKTAAPKPAANPLQFIKVGPCDLYKAAQEQLKKVEEIKKVEKTVKDESEDWQSNLEGWKCTRRKRQEHIIERVVEVKKIELEEHERNRRRGKTLSEMIEERSQKGVGPRKMSLLTYPADDESADLADLGIETLSSRNSVEEDSFKIQDDADAVISNCESKGDSKEPSREPEHTYESAIQGYKSFAEKNVKIPLKPRVSPPKLGGRIGQKLNELEQVRLRSNSVSDIQPPKVDIHKRRSLFEVVESAEIKSPSAQRIAKDLAGAKIVQERLSSFEKTSELLAPSASEIISSSLKLSNLGKENEISHVHTASEEDVAIRERLSSLENGCKESVISSCSDEEMGQKELLSPAVSDREVSSPLVVTAIRKEEKTDRGNDEVLVPTTDENSGINAIAPDSTDDSHDTKTCEVTGQSNSRSLGFQFNRSKPKPILRIRKLTPMVPSPPLSPASSPVDLQTICENEVVEKIVTELAEIKENEDDNHKTLGEIIEKEDVEKECAGQTSMEGKRSAESRPDENLEVGEAGQPVPKPRLITLMKGAETSESGIDMEESSLYTDENIDEVLGEDDEEGDYDNLPDSANDLQRMRRHHDNQSKLPSLHTRDAFEVSSNSFPLSHEFEDEAVTRFDGTVAPCSLSDSIAKETKREKDSLSRLDDLVLNNSSGEERGPEDEQHVGIAEGSKINERKQSSSEIFSSSHSVPVLFQNLTSNGFSSTKDVMTFPLIPKNCIEPPKEKPPPPPVESDEEEVPQKVSPGRFDSTKRIKKEIMKKRSDFLGIKGAIDDHLLEPEVSVKLPDLTKLLEEERRLDRLLLQQSAGSERTPSEGLISVVDNSDKTDQSSLRQSISSEADSNHDNAESRDSGVELDRGAGDDVSWKKSPEPCDHPNIDVSGVIGDDDDELARKEREIIFSLEREEKSRQRKSSAKLEENVANDVVSEKFRELEKEKLKLEWARAEEEGRRMADEERLLAKETLLRQQENSPLTNQRAGSQDNLRAERERLEQEQIELARARQRLLTQQSRSQGPIGTNLRYSMPNLQDTRLPASEPRSAASWSRISSIDNLLSSPDHLHHLPPQPPPQQMSRTTLHALSAAPRSRIVNGEAWMQPKRKNEASKSAYNYQHWLIQEAEHRRITEQQQRVAQSRRSLPVQPRSPAQAVTPRCLGNFPSAQNSPSQSFNGIPHPQSALVPSHHMVGLPPAPLPPSQTNKPLPEAVIQTLTQRVQSKTSPKRRVEDRLPPSKLIANEPPCLNGEQERMLSVSGKKRCSHCGDELGRGAAMVIESLRLFYHIDCFKCCVCHTQLGDGLMGTDVRVRNNKLHCHNCYSSDDGVKFSCV